MNNSTAHTCPPDAARDSAIAPDEESTRAGPMHPVRIAALRRALDVLPFDVVCDAIGKEVGDFLAARASELDALRARVAVLERHAMAHYAPDANRAQPARRFAPTEGNENE